MHANRSIRNWLSLGQQYLDSTEIRTHPIIYERLKSDLKVELESAIRFLNVTLDPEKIQCVIKNSEGRHHRKANSSITYPLELYPKKIVKVFNDDIDKVADILQRKFDIDISFYKR